MLTYLSEALASPKFHEEPIPNEPAQPPHPLLTFQKILRSPMRDIAEECLIVGTIVKSVTAGKRHQGTDWRQGSHINAKKV